MKTFVRFIIAEEKGTEEKEQEKEKAEDEESDDPYEEWEEKCFIRLNNFRELVLNEAGEVVEAAGSNQMSNPIGDKRSNAGGRNSQLSQAESHVS